MSVLLTAVVAVAVLLGAAVADLGTAAVDKARADNAADAAALVAAGELTRGRTPAQACARARSTAAGNGARLLTCHCAVATARVVVEVGAAKAHARAGGGDLRSSPE